jgi:hypothetical protein
MRTNFPSTGVWIESILLTVHICLRVEKRLQRCQFDQRKDTQNLLVCSGKAENHCLSNKFYFPIFINDLNHYLFPTNCPDRVTPSSRMEKRFYDMMNSTWIVIRREAHDGWCKINRRQVHRILYQNHRTSLK